MIEEKTEAEITIEMSEKGFRRVLVGANNDEEFAAAHRLMARVAPQLRALDKALRDPEPTRIDCGTF